MAYIVLLNPIILTSIPGTGGQPGADVSGTVLPFPAIAAVTALLAGVLTILMGVVGRYPFAVATGLGINAIVAVFAATQDRKSTRLNSSHANISYAVFCLKKKKKI